MMKVSVTGQQHLLGLVGLYAKYTLGLGHGAHMAGQLLLRTAQEGMHSAGGGALYAGAKRQAGAPGGYPAVQSGQLIGSLDYQVQGISRLEFGSRGAFNRGFDYAIAQEMGTSKMAPRPYLKLTVDRTRAQIASILGDSVYRAIVS